MARSPAGISLEPVPVSSELTDQTLVEEADRLGWLLYADKQALRAGRASEVAERILRRARLARRGLIVSLGFEVALALSSLASAFGSGRTALEERHPYLCMATSLMLLALVFALVAFVIPSQRRVIARIERGLRSRAQAG